MYKTIQLYKFTKKNKANIIYEIVKLLNHWFYNYLRCNVRTFLLHLRFGLKKIAKQV